MSSKVPPQGGTARQVARGVNQALDGKLDAAKRVSVTDAVNPQTFSDPLVSAGSVILISPLTTATRDALVTSQSDGSFQVTFPSSPSGETLAYVVIG